MNPLFYVHVQFEADEQIEYPVHAVSAQAAVDIISTRFREIPHDVVRVTLCQTDWIEHLKPIPTR